VAVGRLSVAWRTDSPVRHRTLSGAPATSPSRWILTIGASDIWATGQSGGAPDSHCSLSGAPSGAALNSGALRAHCSAFNAYCKRPLARSSRCSAGTPDSPVNYSGAAPRIPEGGEFGAEFPGAPDTVRWCTGHCPVAHRTVRCPRPGHTSVVFCSFNLNPFLVFSFVCCEPLAPVRLII
jgi:hypothetical protein